ncbi:hypothetical protein A0H81_08695 [Grifola frondosa]|uniref:Uncharacterized protein n=1 Tax=Grifola frondosa TaxID=5627 RepID=A0A1C7M3I0_GRIFR|nr:hypothetical protein A0H81_08695 [Grifola frondosa]
MGCLLELMPSIKYRPHELMIVHSPKADLSQLMDIARIANKYSFGPLRRGHSTPSMTTSIASPLLSIPSSRTPPLTPTQRSPLPQTAHSYPALYTSHRYAITSSFWHHDMLLRQLMSLSIQYAYLAMTLADELDLRASVGSLILK